jgi:peptidoglycan/xylan/chitin deacetylase (PgdA/CDA1 family)
MPTSSNAAENSSPGYYSALEPFQPLFAQGNPVLTYHKLGPRPARVRLKGLYVSAKLFSSQLAELRVAGFQSGALADCGAPLQPRRIVITFDDGYVNVLRHGLGPLAQHGFQAIEFLPADLLGKRNEWDVAAGEAPETIMDAAQVRDWLAAGHTIGSHTLDHPWLTALPAAAAREQIFASRKKLEDLFGVAVEHFCYPYGDWNPAVRDLVVAAGYRTACTTNSGVNRAGDSPWELKRFTARYPSRNWKTLLAAVRRRSRQWF